MYILFHNVFLLLSTSVGRYIVPKTILRKIPSQKNIPIITNLPAKVHENNYSYQKRRILSSITCACRYIGKIHVVFRFPFWTRNHGFRKVLYGILAFWGSIWAPSASPLMTPPPKVHGKKHFDQCFPIKKILLSPDRRRRYMKKMISDAFYHFSIKKLFPIINSRRKYGTQEN